MKRLWENVKKTLRTLFCCECWFCYEEDSEEENQQKRVKVDEEENIRRWLNACNRNHRSYFSQQMTIDAIRKVDEDNKLFAKTLKNQGHRCVVVYETIPTKVCWCESDGRCRGPNYFP